MNEMRYEQVVENQNKINVVLKDRDAIVAAVKETVAKGMTNFVFIQQLDYWKRQEPTFKKI